MCRIASVFAKHHSKGPVVRIYASAEQALIAPSADALIKHMIAQGYTCVVVTLA